MSETITKAKLAEKLGISKSRVSQFVKEGMPVELNGGVDLTAALNWLNQFTRYGPLLTRVQELRRGDTAAPKAAEPAPASGIPKHLQFVEMIENDGDRGAVLGAMQMAYWAPQNAATIALAAGSTVAQAWVIYRLHSHAAMARAAKILRAMHVEPFASEDDPPVWVPEGRAAIDWKATAKGRGEEYDPEAWDKLLQAI